MVTDSAGHPCCNPHPGGECGTWQRREERSFLDEGKQRIEISSDLR
jgi:hypothetical protein